MDCHDQSWCCIFDGATEALWVERPSPSGDVTQKQGQMQWGRQGRQQLSFRVRGRDHPWVLDPRCHPPSECPLGMDAEQQQERVWGAGLPGAAERGCPRCIWCEWVRACVRAFSVRLCGCVWCAPECVGACVVCLRACLRCVPECVCLGLLNFSPCHPLSQGPGGASVPVCAVSYLRRNYPWCVRVVCDESYKDNFFLSIKSCLSGLPGPHGKFRREMHAASLPGARVRLGAERACT